MTAPFHRLTFAALAAIPDDGLHHQHEIIDGQLVSRPVPPLKHQFVLGRLYRLFDDAVQAAHAGAVLQAPTKVELGAHTVLEPDLSFVAREHYDRLQRNRIAGAPDIVAEVLSPGTWNHDRRTKLSLYALAGVREYWLVDPLHEAFEVRVLVNGRYELVPADPVGTMTSRVPPGLIVDGPALLANIPGEER